VIEVARHVKLRHALIGIAVMTAVVFAASVAVVAVVFVSRPFRVPAAREVALRVDPTLDANDARRSGDISAGRRGTTTTHVETRREDDGRVLLEVRQVREPYTFLVEIWFEERPGSAPLATAKARSLSKGGFPFWPMHDLEGDVRVSSARVPMPGSVTPQETWVAAYDLRGQLSGSGVEWSGKVAIDAR
jgi:hypothetical protein